MKNHLSRFYVIVVVFCSVSVSFEGARAENIPDANHQQGDNIKTCDGWDRGWMEERQQPIDGSITESSQPSRVGTLRSSRVLPTNGGNTGRNNSLNSNFQFNLFKFASLLLCYEKSCLRLEVVSPRLYYVIALRRILC